MNIILFSIIIVLNVINNAYMFYQVKEFHRIEKNDFLYLAHRIDDITSKKVQNKENEQ